MSWALILGASSGTGAAIARAVAREPGLHVLGFHRGRHAAAAAAVERDVAALGRQVVLEQADAATPEGAAAGAAALLRLAGPRSVDLFVHSIAAGSVGRLISGEEDQLHPKQVARTFETMAHSFVYWAQALVAADLLADGALLLGLTNPLGEQLLRNTVAITAAKAALEIYVRHLALELGPRGHTVCLLKFGTVWTPALDHVYDEAARRSLEAAHERMIPAGRMCTTDEVAALVPLLLDRRSRWFNGSTIDFTGGMTLRLLDLVLNS